VEAEDSVEEDLEAEWAAREPEEEALVEVAASGREEWEAACAEAAPSAGFRRIDGRSGSYQTGCPVARITAVQRSLLMSTFFSRETLARIGTWTSSLWM